MKDIIYLDFDSTLFGYKVGKININHADQLKALSQTDYKLIYVIPDNEESVKYLKSKGTIYEKVSLINKNVELAELNTNIVSCVNNEINDGLLNLTLKSGAYSRFAVDEHFVSNEYVKLYELWIKKSLSGSIAHEVFVYKIEDKIIGFITLAIKGESCNIGLIAVDENSRGMGIGKALLGAAHNFAIDNQLKSITVSTQGDNVLALNFYNKFGFEINQTESYYHHWNL